MLLPSRVAGRTLGLRGPDLARGSEVARLCSRSTVSTQNLSIIYRVISKSCPL